jgi:putative phage-type endonuclease
MEPEVFLKECIPTFIASHPEWVVNPNYNDLIYNEVIKLAPVDKEYYQSNINRILNELNLDRSRPSEPSIHTISEEHISMLQNIPQPQQRTPEWYEFRHQHITASNAWKAFGTNSTKNQLIYEKCKPIITKQKSPTFNENSMTWGHKYEPLTRMIYEVKNDTLIQDFGCIEHPKYPFLAASPDGIVIGKNNFGRMIEIKNVVSRVIDGIPKKDYYTQVLLQMEVCDLLDADFVESKFTEYADYNEFLQDSNETLFVSKEDKMKGCIMEFVKDGEYMYVYMPFTITTETELNQWLDENMAQNANWIKTLYWKLDVYSCVLIKRNPAWFAYAIPHLQELWNTICIERLGDYSIRAPKKRNNKIDIKKVEDSSINECT